MNQTNQVIRPIKPPVEIPTGYEWLWWVLGGLALAVAAVWLWRWWRRRAERVPPPVVIPAHVRAREKLEQALQFIEQPREFCILVSDAVRWYLEERFSFRAPERTTEEFLHDLQRTDLLAPLQKERLGNFLQRCDLVKFAKYEPAEAELRELHAAALRLVDETAPGENNQAPGVPGQPLASP